MEMSPFYNRRTEPAIGELQRSRYSFAVCAGVQTPSRTDRRQHEYITEDNIGNFIYSLDCFYDRSTASSKVCSPQGAIQCFLFKIPVSPHFLEVIR